MSEELVPGHDYLPITDNVLLDLEDLYEAFDEERLEEIQRCQESPLYFMQKYLKVIPKQGGEPVAFNLNRIQKITYKRMKERFWNPSYAVRPDGSYVGRFQRARVAGAKPRQVGFSTYFIGLILHDSLFWEYTTSNITLHKAEYSAKMLNRLRTMLDNLPDFLKPDRDPDDKDSSGTISFKQTHSSITIGSPGKSAEISGDQGRSETLQNCLISEMPRYPFADEFFQAMSAAFKYGNCYVESTPLVVGDLFYRLVMRGLGYSTGTDSDVSEEELEDNWLGLFFPWVYHEEYQLPIATERERQNIRETLTDSEAKLFAAYPDETTEEKIKWRRHTIRDDFEGNEYAFQCEYPEDVESAFAVAGASVFVDPNYELRRISCEAREPIPGHFHAIGVDCAKGLGGQADSNSITVIDIDTQEQVYKFSSNTFPDTRMPEKVYEVWKRYPGFVGVESNNIGEGVMAILRYNDEYVKDKLFQKMLYCGSKQHDGFYTTTPLKIKGISRLYQALKDWAVYDTDIRPTEGMPDEPVGLRLCDKNTVKQLSTFVDFGNGVMGASKGSHDDDVMSLMIAWWMFPYAVNAKRRFWEMKNSGKYD